MNISPHVSEIGNPAYTEVKKRLTLTKVILLIAALLGVCCFIYYGIYKILFTNFENSGKDFKICYDSAIRYLKNKPVYFITADNPQPLIYPPISLCLYLPFTILAFEKARLLWFSFSHIAVVLSGVLLYSIGSMIHKFNSLVASIVVIGFSLPLYVAIFWGNANVIILLLICFLFYFLLMKKNVFIPLIVLLGSYLKIFPAFLLIALFKNKQWQLIKVFILLFLIVGAASFIIFGFDNNIEYLTGTIGRGMDYVDHIPATSFTFLLKLFISNDTNVFFLNLVFTIILVIIWWFKGRAKINGSDPQANLIVDLLILSVITIIVFPSAWYHYHLFLIIPFYFIIFFRLNGVCQFDHFGLFIFLFLLVNFWEIIVYHFPYYDGQITILEIGSNKKAYPILYPLAYSLPFLFNILFYSWLLLNYESLIKGVRSILIRS